MGVKRVIECFSHVPRTRAPSSPSKCEEPVSQRCVSRQSAWTPPCRWPHRRRQWPAKPNARKAHRSPPEIAAPARRRCLSPPERLPFAPAGAGLPLSPRVEVTSRSMGPRLVAYAWASPPGSQGPTVHRRTIPHFGSSRPSPQGPLCRKCPNSDGILCTVANGGLCQQRTSTAINLVPEVMQFRRSRARRRAKIDDETPC
jgi:hypothetical protein